MVGSKIVVKGQFLMNFGNERTGYVLCLYEKLFGKISGKILANSGILSGKTWKRRAAEILILYCLIIIFYKIVVILFKDFIPNLEQYKWAVFPLGTLIAWPYIIILDSEMFFDKYRKLVPAFKEDNMAWYAESAKESFDIDDGYKKFHVGTTIIICCIVLNIIFYLAHLYWTDFVPEILYKIITTPYILAILPMIGLVATFFLEKNKNINIILLVVLCGYSYYIYVTEYSPHGISPFFSKEFVVGTIGIILAIGIVFFVAGTTIYPMLGMIKAFYMTKIEDKISFPIKSITKTAEAINEIQKYFIHLTIINLIACFQLLACVYSLGLLSRGSVVTIILFLIGSLFPFTMYMAQDFFYRKLVKEVYNRQAEIIDTKIDDVVNGTNFDGGAIQGYVALKQMYDQEFDAHHTRRLDIIVAVISPIITAVLALIFPGLLG